MKPPTPIHQGLRLPPFGLNRDQLDIFSISDHSKLVSAINALLNLRVVEGESADFKISDLNALLTVPRQNENLVTLENFLPFQIYRAPASNPPISTDWRTVRVSAGWMTCFDLYQRGGAISISVPNSANHDTNIILDADTTTYIYAKLEFDVSDWVATIGSTTNFVADEPLWLRYPDRQGFRQDDASVEGSEVAFAVIGKVQTVSTTKTATITQLVYDNIHIPFFHSDYGPPTTWFGHTTWLTGTFYPINTIIKNAGVTYIRATANSGDDGGDPAGGNDWVTL